MARQAREEVKTHARSIEIDLGKVVVINEEGVDQKLGPIVNVDLVCVKKRAKTAYAIVPGFYALEVNGHYDGEPEDISDEDVRASIRGQLLSGKLVISREGGEGGRGE